MKNQRSNIIICTLLLLFLSFAVLGSASATVFSSNFLKNLSLLADPDEIYNHQNPKMTVSDQFVHVLWWAAKKDWSVNVIFYIRSTDGGKTFGAAHKLAEGKCENFSNEWNNFQADGPYIHVFYTCASQGSLIYLRSDDYGVTFKPKEVFSTGSYTPTDVYLTSGAGNLAIAWSKPLYSALHTDLICSYSTDGGTTFHHTTIAAISDKYSAGVADIVRSGNYLYILAWTQDLGEWGTASRLLLYASWDGGATFKPPVRVTVPASDGNPYALKIQSANYSPNLFAEGNTVNIVWHNNDGPPTDYYWYAPTLRTCRSSDGGLTLTSPITLHTNPVGYDSSPTFGLETIAGKGSNLYITAVLEAPLSTDKPAGTYVWRSTDSGTSWGAAKLVAPGGWWPHIGVDPTDSSTIHLTNSWYFQSLDAGNTFTGGVNPTVDAGDWNDPNMSISNDGVVHSCGSHGGAYNGHIYYRRIAPEPEPGSLNQALSLTTSYLSSVTRMDNIQIPAFSNINFSTQMTVEFWVQRTSDVQPPYGWCYFEHIFKKKYGTYGTYGSYQIGAWNNFEIFGRLITDQTDTTSGAFMGTGITLLRDTWTHIAMTYDAALSSNNWKMYVNGKLAKQMDVKGAILLTPSPLVIGNDITTNLSEGSMEIDELRLWNRPLSESEIAQNMFRTLTGGENGLSAYYNFNDTFKELTGKGFDAMPMYWETFVPSTIPMPTPVPVLSVMPTNQVVAEVVGTTAFSVSNTGTATMPWTAAVTTGGSWLTITSGASGTNSGTINCSFTANTSTSSRTATIRVTAAGATGSPQEVTVIQAGLNSLTISGSVKISSGTAISEVSITFSNGGGTATTDSGGNYSVTVPYNYSGAATPSKNGFAFIPTSRTYSDVTANKSSENYAATPLTNPIIGSNSIDGVDVVKITDMSGSLPAGGGAVTIKAWDKNGKELTTVGYASPLSVSNYGTTSILGQDIEDRFSDGTPAAYTFSVESPKMFISNVNNSIDGSVKVPIIYSNGLSNFVSNSIGSRNTLKVTDMSGTIASAGIAITVAAWDATGKAIPESTSAAPMKLNNHGTTTIAGSSLTARFPSGTPMTYEFTIASPKLIVSNVKNSSDGTLNIPTVYTIGVSKFVSNSIGFRNTIYISDFSGTLDIGGAAIKVRAWDVSGAEIPESESVSSYKIAKYETVKINGAELANRFSSGSPMTYEFTVDSPNVVITIV